MINRDPLYTKIQERLQGNLDGHVFEDCAADLILREGRISVVPVGGTQDGGRDGAVADLEEEPYPLVVTTGEDTTGNLRRNLDSYLKEGGERRKTVFATSQTLTNRRMQNLQEAARAKGFTLVQIFHGKFFANALYRDPAWCKELLGVSGDPCPLSKVPLSMRPVLNTAVVGRGNDLRWLTETKGDRLLVGQPGSGKTFLAKELVNRELGLFVISRDREEIAEGLREQEPTLLIVDDASPDDPILEDLRQLREAVYANFSILATCWPRHKQYAADALGLVESHIHELPLMTQVQIAQVIEDTGIKSSNLVMNELVRQAEGRPGLAATLANAVLQGGWQEIVTGSVLFSTLARHIQDESLLVLGVIAVSGNKGLTVKEVARALDLRPIEVWRLVRDCQTAGVVTDIANLRLSVRPPTLRCPLLAEVFFEGALSYPIEDVIDVIGQERVDVDVLIGTRARGVRIPDRLIRPMLDTASSWRDYASLGRPQARYVLANYPEQRIVDVGEPLLHYCPERALDLLFKASVGDTRPVHTQPEAPMRLVSDWITDAYPATESVLKRRGALLSAIDRWLSSGDDVETGLRACEWVMSLNYHRSGSLDVHHQVTLHFGLISPQDASRLEAFWPDIIGFYRATGSKLWKPLYHIIHEWAFPHAARGQSGSDEFRRRTKEFAATMLSDLLELAAGEQDVIHWATKIKEQAGLDVEIPDLDWDFEVLYPVDRLTEDWRQARAEQVKNVETLAREWSTGNPTEIIQKLTQLEAAGERLETVRERWTPYLCKQMAELVTNPLEWSASLIDADLRHDLIVPFLRKASKLAEPGWEEQLMECLSKPPSYQIVEFVLTLAEPPEEALAIVLSNAPSYPDWIGTCCLRGKVPEETTLLLLRHSDTDVTQEAAHGEWHADPKGEVRESLVEVWRRVIAASELDHSLEEMLRKDAELAADWLQANIHDLPLFLGSWEQESLKSVIGVLTSDMRSEMLDQLPGKVPCHLIIKLLVGDDLPLYAKLLDSAELSRYHLAPLSGLPDEKWIVKAQLALESYLPSEIAEATIEPLSIETSWGPMSAKWQLWIEAFDPLRDHDDERIREVAKNGRRYAQRRYDEAIARERQEAIYGW